MQLRLMLDCKRGQMKIGHQLACSPRTKGEILDKVEVVRARMNDSRMRLFQPRSDVNARWEADCLLRRDFR
jgi:hypothetical protein